MAVSVSEHVDLSQFIQGVHKRNLGQPEFVQAVQEVAEDVFDHIQDKGEYQILRRIAEPDRVVSFRVCWEDDGTPGEDHIDYVRGANISGFVKVADAMLAFGVV